MNTVERVVNMAQQLRDAAADVAQITRALDEAKARCRRIEQVDLPELMREVGVTQLALEDGTALSLEDDFSCAITEANASAALRWLREHGFGALIKSQVIAEFGRGEEQLAERAAGALELQGIFPMRRETVHPATLKSFVREQMAAGKPPPFDLFSIHVMAKAKLAAPRNKRC